MMNREINEIREDRKTMFVSLSASLNSLISLFIIRGR